VPISIDEFESSEVPSDDESVPLRVARYVHAHADQAFTRAEIAAAIEADPNTVGTALSRMKNMDLVRHRGTYWAITEDTDRLLAAYDLHTAHETQAAWEHEHGDAAEDPET
jgi:Mn-dependent DtxR family transcriptional regulator